MIPDPVVVVTSGVAEPDSVDSELGAAVEEGPSVLEWAGAVLEAGETGFPVVVSDDVAVRVKPLDSFELPSGASVASDERSAFGSVVVGAVPCAALVVVSVPSGASVRVVTDSTRGRVVPELEPDNGAVVVDGFSVGDSTVLDPDGVDSEVVAVPGGVDEAPCKSLVALSVGVVRTGLWVDWDDLDVTEDTSSGTPFVNLLGTALEDGVDWEMGDGTVDVELDWLGVADVFTALVEARGISGTALVVGEVKSVPCG